MTNSASQRKKKLLKQPLAEIPASELWLYRNKKALVSVERGLKDATRRRVSKIKS